MAFSNSEVLYEVWRTHAKGGRDVLVQPMTDEGKARSVLRYVVQDKSENYSDAPLDFYLSRVTLHREQVTD